MKFLTSIVNDEYTLDKIGKSCEELRSFLKVTDLDGFEILVTDPFQYHVFPKDMRIGNHLFFYPIWLDFIKEDYPSLLNEFKDMKTVEQYYRANSRQEYIENLREELVKAEKINFEYVVLHVSHMTLEESYTGKYKYRDDDVIDEFIKIVNEATEGLELSFELLFENNWYPGFTFLNNGITRRLLSEIHYKNVGFVLDTGHLIHTNTSLRTEDEAMDYINFVLDNMGELKKHIKCIHLNLSLSGEYREKTAFKSGFDKDASFYENMENALEHIGRIDNHKIFNHNKVRDLIISIDPQFVVFELSFSDKADLIEKIGIQDSFIQFKSLKY